VIYVQIKRTHRHVGYRIVTINYYATRENSVQQVLQPSDKRRAYVHVNFIIIILWMPIENKSIMLDN